MDIIIIPFGLIALIIFAVHHALNKKAANEMELRSVQARIREIERLKKAKAEEDEKRLADILDHAVDENTDTKH